jgi:hypothetical protein
MLVLALLTVGAEASLPGATSAAEAWCAANARSSPSGVRNSWSSASGLRNSRSSASGLRNCAPTYVSGTFDLKLRNAEAQSVLNKILADEAFWAGAWRKTYDNQLYDEIRLKSTDTGYVPMISGEGQQDFEHEVVADIVYRRNVDLPKYMSGAKVVLPLGSGFDPVVGAEYRDSLYVLDLTLFYGYFPQRMYRKHDAAKNETVLWFEKLDSRFVDAATWTSYQAKMKTAIDGVDRRWPPFNAMIEVSDVYGMFVVEPGTTRKSRVSFVSKLTFDKDAGIVANWGSQMPPVVRAGIQAGFDASVAIAKHETEKRAKAAGGTKAP